jgi:nucleotide-binding universal stress UspA family protein
MKNILVPTDFSATAQNAARYALEFAKQTGAPKIILFNAYQAPMMVDPLAMVPAVQLLDEGQLKEDSTVLLNKCKLVLQAFCPNTCEIEIYSEYALLNNGLDEVCAKTGSGLVVMGITGGGALEETLIGSNTLNVSRHSTVPVIIVPADTKFTSIRNVLLACDFKVVLETTPVQPIKDLLKQTSAKLNVLNIDHHITANDSDIPFESKMLGTLLHDCDPEFHFLDNKDFMDAINGFVQDHDINLVITIPKKHGLLESLFTRSHTKKMAFHSHVPVMIVHD